MRHPGLLLGAFYQNIHGENFLAEIPLIQAFGLIENGLIELLQLCEGEFGRQQLKTDWFAAGFGFQLPEAGIENIVVVERQVGTYFIRFVPLCGL